MVMEVEKISHLTKREIQAPLVVAFIKGLIKEFGQEKAFDIASRIIEADARLNGEALGGEYGQNLKGLKNVVENIWCEDGAMVIEVVEESDTVFAFNVTKCGYAEMYERLGIKEFGSCLSCNRDYAFGEGFSPSIKLERTKTIMEGASHCDFRFLKK